MATTTASVFPFLVSLVHTASHTARLKKSRRFRCYNHRDFPSDMLFLWLSAYHTLVIEGKLMSVIAVKV